MAPRLEGAGINMSAGYIIAKAQILLVASNIERIATSPTTYSGQME